MKWLERKKQIKKKDERSTYLTIENGRVVPVPENKKEEIHDKTPEEKNPHRQYDASEEVVAKTKWAKSLNWLWLIVIFGLGYGTFQLFSGLASENQETLKLQEIERNTLQVIEEVVPDEQDTDKADNNVQETPVESVKEKTETWKDELKGSFTEDADKSDDSLAETPEPGISKSLLFSIRSLDETGTVLLEQIREGSVLYIQEDISRGQYLLRLQSVELKTKRYAKELAELTALAKNQKEYETLLAYVDIKKESLNSLSGELRSAPLSDIAPIFNSYVDTHNVLTTESDAEFVSLLKSQGYDVTMTNGIIEYQ